MEKEYFLAKTFELLKDVTLAVYFDKNQNFEEMFECKLELKIKIAEDQYVQREFNCRYVTEDKMIAIDELMKLIMKELKELIKLVESVDSGLNQLPFFTLEQQHLSSMPIDVRRDLKRALQNVTEYKLQPFIIDLYNSVLVKYKGTDTLQKRKFQKMIEAQEDAMRFYRSGGRMF